MGTNKYNADFILVTQAIKTVEKLGKEFHWPGEIKHSEVIKIIESLISFRIF